MNVGMGLHGRGFKPMRYILSNITDRKSTHKITDMNPGQGLAANLATALLVNTASYHGLPVSTTHVSVGSVLGIGITTRQAKWKPVMGVLLSSVITLPCAAVLAAVAYLVLRPH
jgi:PiT family inorganic phosphate transporter